ncbi:hypothetical protein ACW73L_20670 [Methylolobus aquaticus]
MASLQSLQSGTSVLGGLLHAAVSVEWFGSDALELTYKEPEGKVGNQLLYQDDEPRRSATFPDRSSWQCGRALAE